MTTPISILVVDDEAGICQNVEKILKKDNFDVSSATSAREALEKLAKKQFDLIISDVVMPQMNGLQLLKTLKSKYPATKTVMMTAFASTDTAMRAIRLGALDYLPKPFTPDELRAMVDQALSGKLIEAKVSPDEREAIPVIDLDPSVDTDTTTGDADMSAVEITSSQPLEGFCEVGEMVCDIFKKLGATCKAGTKTGACPQKKKKKGRSARTGKGPDVKTLIGIDQPFDYDEVRAETGPQYINYLRNDGVVMPTYEELKANVADMTAAAPAVERIETDPVLRTADNLEMAQPDAPVVEIMGSESLEGFCQVGEMVCDIFKKLGATCKAGTKTGACPQKKKNEGRSAKTKKGPDVKTLIGIDQPFNYDEVRAVTGPQYINYLHHDGVVMPTYEELKAGHMAMMAQHRQGQPAHKGPTAQAEAGAVLVVDDEVAVNNNIRKILAKKHYRVDQAASKAEALEKVAAKPYELVLLDLRMPGVHGLELLAAIRQIQPKAKVIIVTGYASIDTAKEAARMGAVDYLPKPFTPGEIRDAAQRAVRLAA